MSGIWGEVVGQPGAVAHLESAAERPVHAYLFVGPPGSTKREAALAFAALLLCEPGGGCGECRACRLALAGEHPDVRWFEREGASILIDAAREIGRQAGMKPVEGNRQVLVLDEFHLLSPEAAATLLKTVEEPPPGTFFVILADDVPPDLVTIASRSQRVDFRPIARSEIERRLHQEGVPADAAAEAALAANGDLDRARVLAGDAEVGARLEAFRRLPHRLDGTGATVAHAVDELLGLIDAAAEPLKARQALEEQAMAEREAVMGKRGSGRAAMDTRHKRELRRHRADELRAGLLALAGVYRDRLATGKARDPQAELRAIGRIQAAVEAIERNPNEPLLLQALLLALPIA
jgi:DNA polymerase III subunit delta'